MTLKEEISNLLGSEGIAKIKAALKFAVEPTPVIVEVKLEDVVLNDGNTLVVDKMEVGGKAELKTADGIAPAPDGEYTDEKGTVITVMGGLISEIATAEAEVEEEVVAPVEPVNEMAAILERLAAIESKFESQGNENKSLKTELSEVKKNLAVSLEAIDKIVSMPVAMSLESKNKPAKKVEDMTALERFRYYKSLEK
jgi:hypothetical protein